VGIWALLSEPPWAMFLTQFDSPNQQQGLCFLPKITCNVRNVEVAKAWRLTSNSIELISFTVPRLKKEYFQDDIFVPTTDISQSVITQDQWLNGMKAIRKTVDLKPADMKCLSEVISSQNIVSTKNLISKKPISDAERRAAMLDNMFKSAKDEESAAESDKKTDDNEVAPDEWDN